MNGVTNDNNDENKSSTNINGGGSGTTKRTKMNLNEMTNTNNLPSDITRELDIMQGDQGFINLK